MDGTDQHVRELRRVPLIGADVVDRSGSPCGGLSHLPDTHTHTRRWVTLNVPRVWAWVLLPQPNEGEREALYDS